MIFYYYTFSGRKLIYTKMGSFATKLKLTKSIHVGDVKSNSYQYSIRDFPWRDISPFVVGVRLSGQTTGERRVNMELSPFYQWF